MRQTSLMQFAAKSVKNLSEIFTALASRRQDLLHMTLKDIVFRLLARDMR
jgi:hypothetical protein